MGTHRYILEPYSGKASRFQCPSCQHKRKTFTRYIDTQSGNNYAGEQFGRCDRLIKCGYARTPNSETRTLGSELMNRERVVNNKNRTSPASYIPKEKFLSHIRIGLPYSEQLSANPFFQYLHELFNTHGEGEKIVSELIRAYYIGTGDRKQTIFFQLDQFNKVRSGKIMSYDAKTGKRIKSKGAYWLHTTIPDFNLVQCLFGEHLLRKHRNKPVAIVESEKTAIIASVYLPEYNWLACGSLQSLKASKYTDILTNKHIILFPDLSAPVENRPSAVSIWKKESKQFEYAASIQVSTLLEELASPLQKEKGLDIADFLVQFDYVAYQQQFSSVNKKNQYASFQKASHIPIEDYKYGLHQKNGVLMYKGYPATWDLTANYIDERTKQLIKACEQNKYILQLMTDLSMEMQV
ncbi:MAG: DUF6371 domain-containing protein [Cyclobacteriaceae bacterium]